MSIFDNIPDAIQSGSNVQIPNPFNYVEIDRTSFAFANLLAQDKWIAFTPVFGSLTVVGATTYTGRIRFIGRGVEFQVMFLAATSIASVAGTSYFTLPVTSKGIAGEGRMTNDTTKIGVGICHMDVVNSKCFLPAQAASGNTFHLSGSYEI